MYETGVTQAPNGVALLAAIYLLAMLSIATVTDLLSHRIPNALLAPSLLVAAILGVASAGFAGLLAAGAGLFVGLAMLLPLYVAGGTAAGDVKLLAVAGAYLGPAGAFIAGMFTFIAGAVLGVAWIAWRMTRKSGEPAAVTGKAANAFAYAPAIFAGCLGSAWFQGWTFFGA